MSGIALKLDARQLGVADDILKRLDLRDAGIHLGGLGRMMQMQTQERIFSTKQAPSGAGWKPNRSGTSILQRSGKLGNSIDYAVAGDTVIVGSGVEYARIHQLGGVITPKSAKRLVFRIGNGVVFAMKVTIPARPYLGVSADNARDIIEATADWLRRKLGR